MGITKIHHVAYRCHDAKETVEWYQKYLGMDFILAIAENEVPSTKEPDPYMHVFLDAGQGNVLAFFELPNSPPMGRDDHTPKWVQHIAFQVETIEEQAAIQARVEADGIEVVGPTDHRLFRSIYFFDPNGHRLEVAVPTSTKAMDQALDRVKWDMLNQWAKTKRAPGHARWLHDPNLPVQ